MRRHRAGRGSGGRGGRGDGPRLGTGGAWPVSRSGAGVVVVEVVRVGDG